MYVIYEITNNINGKTYVGQHKTDNINDNYFGSGIAITQAVEKYGKENFTKTILEECNESNVNDREIYWISRRKEEGKAQYNISGGGQACSNPFQYKSEEEKQAIYRKMGETRKGRPSGSSGKTWHKSVVEAPHSNAREVLGKRVIIMETEQEFLSYGECAEFLGVDDSGVRRACLRDQGTAGGYHICFKEGYSRDNNPWFGKERGPVSKKAGKKQETSAITLRNIRAFNQTLSKPVRCLNTGKAYPSIAEAADELNLSKSSITAVLNGRQKSTGGYKFERIDKEEFAKLQESGELPKQPDLLIIMENEAAFKTIKDCADYIGCSPSSIQNHLGGYAKQCKGYHLSYIDNYFRENNPWLGKERYSEAKVDYSKMKKETKKVICNETGEVFESVAKAALHFHIQRTGISAVLSGRRKTVGGYTFKEIE